jgi:hypothetical protein
MSNIWIGKMTVAEIHLNRIHGPRLALLSELPSPPRSSDNTCSRTGVLSGNAHASLHLSTLEGGADAGSHA